MNEMDYLSPHFQLIEFTTSQIASRRGIDNTPPQSVINNLILQCKYIWEPARVALGPIHITSGYRCKALNTLVGGAQNSDHMYGKAGDAYPLKTTKLALALWIVENTPFDQVILEFGIKEDPAWVHASYASNPRRQVLRILDKKIGYEPITF